MHKKLLFLAIIGFLLYGCKKTEGFTPLSDSLPEHPVTVSNATDFRPGPTVNASLADGKIQIILALDQSSPRTIKEITKVSTATSYSLLQGTTNLYESTPIPVNAKTATYNTTIPVFYQKNATIPPLTPALAPATVNNELPRRFFFLLTLDDGTQVIPSDVRVLVVP